MKTLFCIRHAKSSWEHPHLSDFERPLNPRGLRDAPRMAAFLKEKGIVPDRIVTSPAKRAFHTATFFKEGLEVSGEQFQTEARIYDAMQNDLWSVVHALPNTANTVLLFGHNPTFTYFANLFSEELIPNVPTCGICRIESSTEKWQDFGEENARLTAFYYPKMFK